MWKGADERVGEGLMRGDKTVGRGLYGLRGDEVVGWWEADEGRDVMRGW